MVNEYQEFSFLKRYADHAGIPWLGQPAVERRAHQLGDEQKLSGLWWGDGDPALVLLHGGGQNAHTWDTIALDLNVPLVAFDLPGHGHSDWRPDHDYGPWPNADAVAAVLRQTVHGPRPVVGMSLGGTTAIRLAAEHSDLVSCLVIVDSTPNSRGRVLTKEQRGANSLLYGPMVFDSFDAMAAAAAAAIPGRSPESLRPGLLHNARELPDGRWAWRYDPDRGRGRRSPVDSNALWDDVSRVQCPALFVRGGRSAMVQDGDVAELRRRQPEIRVEVIARAGHSVQSDSPRELAKLIREFALG